MTVKRRFMLDRPEDWTSGGRGAHTPGHGRTRSLPAGRPARRGAPLPAHERRLLLPLGIDRAMGPESAPHAGLRVVPRRDLGPPLARVGRRGRELDPTR